MQDATMGKYSWVISHPLHFTIFVDSGNNIKNFWSLFFICKTKVKVALIVIVDVKCLYTNIRPFCQCVQRNFCIMKRFCTLLQGKGKKSFKLQGLYFDKIYVCETEGKGSMPQDAMKTSLNDLLGRTRVKRRWYYSKNGDTALYSVVTLRKSVRILCKFR